MAILIYLLWFLFLGLFSIIFLKKNKNSTSSLRHLPGPRGLPIIGNLHRSKGVLHRWFHQLSLKYGPVMVLRLGSTPIVLISASEAAEEVLKTKDLETCNRPKTVGTGKLSYNYKDISFSQYTDSWRDNRKVTVMELLNPKKIRTFNFIREEETAFMVNKLSESALKQSPVDISNICFCLTANILCRAALGQNLRTNKFFDEKRIEELVTQGMVTAGGFGFSDFIPGRLGKFADWLLQTHKGIEKVLKELDEFYQHVIDDHLRSLELDGRQTTDPPAHIVSGLLAMVNKHGDASKRNLDQVKGTLMDIFIAGIDTGVATMIWTVTELIRNPRVMKKAQEEIRAVLGNKREKITDEDTEKVEYLKLILKETFRLHPVVPNLPRESVSHIKIQGYDIPPNTQIQINVWAIGQDPKIWKNPEEFIPERFLDNPIHYKGQNYELLPFGSGRRMCPGMPMAIPTLELGLLNMLYFFDWKLPEGMVSEDINMDEVGNISSAKKEPLILVPVQHH